MSDRVHWHGCYSGGWGDELHPEAFSHPAKVSYGLAARIYQHAIEKGYLSAGDNVVDPFGGIAGFALHAITNGINWTGVELEANFVELGNQNIALWNERYGRYFADLGKPFGVARLSQGDSRKLAEIVQSAAVCVSSPPFTGVVATQDPNFLTTGEQGKKVPSKSNQASYGRSPGQLGAMPEGAFDSAIQGADAVVSSPPYAESTIHGRTGIDLSKLERPGKQCQAATMEEYGDTAGQLGRLKEGDFSAAISSPPYSAVINGSGEGPGARFDSTHHSPDNANKRSSGNEYGRTPGNLGNMSGYDGVVSSPPFEKSLSMDRVPKAERVELARKMGVSADKVSAIDMEKIGQRTQEYGDTPGNIGNDQGETFWTAARAIVEQVYTVLRPGGAAIWVCGDFVRDGSRVYFGRQWQELCTAVGFTFTEWIIAHKQESRGVQLDIFGNEVRQTVDRVSFFRRLANERNPEAAILNEDVIIVRKP